MKALLTFSVLADHIDRKTPVRATISLYNEGETLIWRIGGPLGDECETLPKPKTVNGAKKDAIAVYCKSRKPWDAKASWMP